ncbi:MAG: hypothetical protein HZC41_04655 [Chloroflexi bacterium]|nr:hypothetical protein [Chloroflexota bacterium]
MLLIVAVGLTVAFVVAQDDVDVEAKIENAMSAAPPAIAQDATILDWPAEAGGEFVVLREGTNGWTCITDYPDSPGNDPECDDKVWFDFNMALLENKEPNVTEAGIAYMLAGGIIPLSVLSNGAEEGDDWIVMPPHIMLLYPEGTDLSQFSTDYTTGGPFVLFPGTPTQLVIVPLADWESE